MKSREELKLAAIMDGVDPLDPVSFDSDACELDSGRSAIDPKRRLNHPCRSRDGKPSRMQFAVNA
jgi:hypothetical protein